MDIFSENLWPDVERLLDPSKCELGELFFISPYLTGNRLRQYLESNSVKHAIVIVQLTPGNVASGSIDLKELRKLAEISTLLSIPDLHAKVIVDKKTAFVGSQNFTQKGERINAEATLITDDESAHNDTLKYARDLMLNANRVTSVIFDQIEKMADELQVHTKMLDEVNRKFDEKFLENDDNIRSFRSGREELNSSVNSEHMELRITRKKTKDLEYLTMVPVSGSKDFTDLFEGYGFQYRRLGLDLNSLRPFWFFTNSSQIGRLYRSWSGGPDKIQFLDPRTTVDHSNVSIQWIDQSEDDWILFTFNYFFDGSHCHVRTLKYEPVIRNKVAHPKMITRRINERAIRTIDENQGAEGCRKAYKELFRQVAYPESNKDYLNPTGYFSSNRVIQMSFSDITHLDWFDEEIHESAYFRFNQPQQSADL